MRRLATFVLGLLVCLLSIASVLAIWARGELLNTDRYVAEVTPLSSDPAIQGDVSDQVTDAILAQFPARIRDDVRPGIKAQADLFVKSPAFPAVWVQVNRAAHRGLVALLRDQQTGAVVIEHGRLFVDLTPVVTAVEKQLAAVSPELVAALPTITLRVDVADAHRIEQARRVVRFLDDDAYWLPPLTVVLFLLTLLLARSRIRAAGVTLLGVALSMGAVLLLVHFGGGLAADRVPDATVSDAAVEAVWGRLTALLQRTALEVGIGAAVLGLLAVAVGHQAVDRRSRTE
jgi:hypothetical protein